MKRKNPLFRTSSGLLEYTITGKGKPILVLHGGHSNADDKLAGKLLNMDEYKFITPSRPGYGNTSLSNVKSPNKASTQIIELMDGLKISSFYVLGFSAGGLTAIALASMYPERVRKLILVSAVTKKWLSVDNPLYKKGKLLFNPKIEIVTWTILKILLSLIPKTLIKMIISEVSTKKVNYISKEDLDEMKYLLGNSRSKCGFDIDLDQDLKPGIFQNISAPTLIIHSKNDKAVNSEHPLLANKKIKKSSLIWIDNIEGHMIWLGEESKIVAILMKSFLKD